MRPRQFLLALALLAPACARPHAPPTLPVPAPASGAERTIEEAVTEAIIADPPEARPVAIPDTAAWMLTLDLREGSWTPALRERLRGAFSARATSEDRANWTGELWIGDTRVSGDTAVVRTRLTVRRRCGAEWREGFTVHTYALRRSTPGGWSPVPEGKRFYAAGAQDGCAIPLPRPHHR